MALYATMLILKFLGIMTYGGAAMATYMARDVATRKLAAHRIGGPAMTVIWTAGYTLMTLKGFRFTELWIVVGAVGSLAANIVLIRNAGRPSLGRWAWLGTALPLVVVITCMVLKPTWEGIRR